MNSARRSVDSDDDYSRHVHLSQESVHRRLGILSSSESETENAVSLSPASKREIRPGRRKNGEKESGGRERARSDAKSRRNGDGRTSSNKRQEQSSGHAESRELGESSSRHRQGGHNQRRGKIYKEDVRPIPSKRIATATATTATAAIVTPTSSGTTSEPIQPRRIFTYESDESQTSVQLLKELIKKMDKHDKRLDSLEKKIDNSGTRNSLPIGASTKKNEVPNAVRSETRRIYKMLMDEDEEGFDGWIICPGMTFRSSENQRTLDRLVRELKALNPDFLTRQISDAAYRYYRSCCEQKSAERRGVSKRKLSSKRRHERLSRKLADRKAALLLQTDQYNKYKATMTLDFISSEESDTDQNGRPIYVVKPLPWRSDEINELFQNLDGTNKKAWTPQSIQQCRTRVRGGEPSTRTVPTDDYPPLSFKNDC